MDPYTESFAGGYWSVNPYVSTKFRETRQATGRALPVVPRTGLCGRVIAADLELFEPSRGVDVTTLQPSPGVRPVYGLL